MPIGSILTEYSCTVGKEVTVISPLGERRGKALYVNDRGALVVDFDGEREEIASGEVSVRGVLGYAN